MKTYSRCGEWVCRRTTVNTTGRTTAARATTISSSWSRFITKQVWRKRQRVRVNEAMAKEPGEQRTGGIARRGVDRQFDDRKLLERPEAAPDFLDSDPWRVLRIQAEFVSGFDALANLGPAVTFFGSARVRPPDPMYDAARALAAELAHRGFAIITGGGPGTMEAAT